ncbi:MAG: UDP-N-acetylmuramoyl-L-alanyl-D-glutamate--2,6-diaminopimelate ligase [Aeromonas sp.]
MALSPQMTLQNLLAPLGITAPAVGLQAMTLDSRQVRVGSLFVALKGHAVDGRQFISQALAQGAAAVLYETSADFAAPSTDVPCIGLPALPTQLSALAARFYAEPAAQIPVVGITGTNGKSTTALLVAQWRELLGAPAGVMGTLGNGFVGQLHEASNTTGSAIEVQGTLRALADAGAALVAMEVSSHGLVQQRVAGMRFAAAAFTNLTRDHLDYHGTMAAYGAAKEQILQLVDAEQMVINADDALGAAWLKKYPQALAISCQGPLPTHGHQLVARALTFHSQGIRAELSGTWGDGVLSAPLLGRFNASNLLTALGLLLLLGFDFARLLATAPQLRPVTGRMECFGGQTQPLAVVDYAHTPDALEQALSALRVHCAGQLWCVFGCGGDRDRGKRPLMAAIAERLADRVILTCDNPRTEDPAQIFVDLQAGLTAPAVQEMDRERAIALALSQAAPGDIVLIAGKGHEDYQIIGAQKRHMSDRETVERLLAAPLTQESCAC